MNTTDMLRGLAAALRDESTKRAAEKQTKAAHVMIAAAGLGLLQKKLGGPRG